MVIQVGMRVAVTPHHRDVFGFSRWDDDKSAHVKRGRVIRREPTHGAWAVEPDDRPGVHYFYADHELRPLPILDELAGLA